LGGTAAYSALTARALGLRVGVVTAWANEIPLDGLGAIPVVAAETEHATRFENVYLNGIRIQYIRQVGRKLTWGWCRKPGAAAKIIHLGPVAQEFPPSCRLNFARRCWG
jgi:hypothetical protein